MMHKTWTMLVMPSSGHVEIYENSGAGKKLIRVARTGGDARTFLGRTVADDDMVTMVEEGQAPAGGIVHLLGSAFKKQFAAPPDAM